MVHKNHLTPEQLKYLESVERLDKEVQLTTEQLAYLYYLSEQQDYVTGALKIKRVSKVEIDSEEQEIKEEWLELFRALGFVAYVPIWDAENQVMDGYPIVLYEGLDALRRNCSYRKKVEGV